MSWLLADEGERGGTFCDVKPIWSVLQMVKDMYNLIHEAADADDQKWHIGNITNGYL